MENPLRIKGLTNFKWLQMAEREAAIANSEGFRDLPK